MSIRSLDHDLNALKDATLEALGVDADTRAAITIAPAPDNMEGDRGFPVFRLAKAMRKKPNLIAEDVAAELKRRAADVPIVARVIAAGPYVNVALDPRALAALAIDEALTLGASFGQAEEPSDAHVAIEFSAPNTNKPQHLGHVRNNLIGQSVANLLAFAGDRITRLNLINDRGVHICKSMLAYQRYRAHDTPEGAGMKGDHFVGHHYVLFNTKLSEEYAAWQSTPDADAAFAAWCEDEASKRARAGALRETFYAAHQDTWFAGLTDDARAELDAAADRQRAYGKWKRSPAAKEAYAAWEADADTADAREAALRAAFVSEYKDAYFNERSEIGAATKQMLIDWEAGDPEVRALWSKMNAWVFAGFDETYTRMGVGFDEVYYESNTYTLGRDLVMGGLESGIFERVEGGAVACDVSQFGMKGDPKILLRSDGTTVYMTQDLGTALERFDALDMDQMIYVVGDEQQHHFKVLFGILGLLRPELAAPTDAGHARLKHLSYGMVELPDGKMKSREGRVVDADDLMQAMHELARDELLKRPIADALRAGDADLSIDDAMERAAQAIEGGDLEALIAEHWPLSRDELDRRAEVVGLAGLKYYVLNFNPKTTVSFDPERSLDPKGKTGVYALYSYARLRSIARKVFGGDWPEVADRASAIGALGTPLELALVDRIVEWPGAVDAAARAETPNPGAIAAHLYEVCDAFSRLYNDADHVLGAMDDADRKLGLSLLLRATAHTIEAAASILGLDLLEEL
jgi:arginyl-tRNA synthetase